ncbi:MAG: alpha/beta fold hydrolase, partial [Planctomycetes bacterium]|nr:alpha/beta fold hydrolase [Planctomycetota bacterium]
RILDLKDGEKTLTVAVWYPTRAEPKEYKYGGGSLAGKVAPDAEPDGGPFPLFVFSHGYGGSGISSVFFTEALAARRWIVAAPDHEDRDKAARIRTGPQPIDGMAYLKRARELAASGRDFDRKAHAYRLDDMKLVLDRMLDSETFGKIIDAKRIAVGGHSLGGFTSLGACGAIEGRRDDRIKAVLLFSPGVFMYDEKEFAAVRVPSMYMLGEKERGEPRAGGTKADLADLAFRTFPAPKYFLEVKGGNHFSFNHNLSDRAWARSFGGTREQHEVIRKYAVAFLERHVAGRESEAAVLEKQDPMLSVYRREGQ